MLKNLYDLQDQQIGLNLGVEVDESIEFDIHAVSIEIYVSRDMLEGATYLRLNASIPIAKLPVRIESNGSWLITLKEIEEYLIKTYQENHFTVHYEEARSGAVISYNNYGDAKWHLHGITKGYS
jgi:hypothetical protein